MGLACQRDAEVGRARGVGRTCADKWVSPISGGANTGCGSGLLGWVLRRMGRLGGLHGKKKRGGPRF